MKKILYIIIAALALTFTSCGNWLDVNSDPNKVTSVENSLIIPSMELNVLNTYGFYGHMMGSYFAQQYAIKPGGPQYLGLAHWDTSDSTPLAANFTNYFYQDAYTKVCNNAQIVKADAEANGKWGDYLLATVLRVFVIQNMVDAIGEIPYSEALNTANLNPKYDEGQEIYAGLLAELDNALAKVSADDKVSDNMVFNSSSDVANWVKFANALKLRILMREYAKVPAAKAALDALVAENNFPTSDIAYAGCWQNQAGLDNPVFSEVVRKRGDLATGRTIEICANMAVTATMNEVNDARIAVKFIPSAAHGNTYEGGFIDEQMSKEIGAKYVDADTYAELNLTYDSPVYLITVAEINFFLAEYYAKVTPDAAKAKAAYEAAIEASFATHGVAGADNIYGAGKKYAWNAAKADELIGIQKWIHLACVNGFESWCEIRRIGYPAFGASTGKQIYDKWVELAKANVTANKPDPTPTAAELIAAGVYTPGTIYTPTYVATGLPDNTMIARLAYPHYSTDRNANAPKNKAATEKVFWAK